MGETGEPAMAGLPAPVLLPACCGRRPNPVRWRWELLRTESLNIGREKGSASSSSAPGIWFTA